MFLKHTKIVQLRKTLLKRGITVEKKGIPPFHKYTTHKNLLPVVSNKFLYIAYPEKTKKNKLTPYGFIENICTLGEIQKRPKRYT